MVGLRPRGFLSPKFVGVFHIEISCLIAYLFFITADILVDDINYLGLIGKIAFEIIGLVILVIIVVIPITNYCYL